MLYRPGDAARRADIGARLVEWNQEADSYREEALATRDGSAPSAAITATAAAAQAGLIESLDVLEEMADAVPPGDPRLAALLGMRETALALLESVGTSLDMIGESTAEPVPPPRHITH